MNGIIKSLRGDIAWSVNDKMVVVLKGKHLKNEGKDYSFIVRIDPPELGLEKSVCIIDLVCKFAESIVFKTELCEFCEKLWYQYLDSHPSVKYTIKRDVKVVTNKAKVEQLRSAVNKMSAQLEVAIAILKEMDI